MQKMEEYLTCAGCGHDNGMHPLDTTCFIGQDGDPPFRSVIISESSLAPVRGRTLNVWFGEEPPDGFSMVNRQRELDTYLRFYCEMCNALTGMAFGFHKGSVIVQKEQIGTVDKNYDGEGIKIHSRPY